MSHSRLSLSYDYGMNLLTFKTDREIEAKFVLAKIKEAVSEIDWLRRVSVEKISLRYINMDSRAYTDESSLLKYAQEWPGGVHRASTDFVKHIVVIGYGRKVFTHEEMKYLDEILQNDSQKKVD